MPDIPLIVFYCRHWTALVLTTGRNVSLHVWRSHPVVIGLIATNTNQASTVNQNLGALVNTRNNKSEDKLLFISTPDRGPSVCLWVCLVTFQWQLYIGFCWPTVYAGPTGQLINNSFYCSWWPLDTAAIVLNYPSLVWTIILWLYLHYLRFFDTFPEAKLL